MANSLYVTIHERLRAESGVLASTLKAHTQPAVDLIAADLDR